MTSPIDVPPEHLKIIKAILKIHLPQNIKVYIFSSRATQTTKDTSDPGLALEGPSRINPKVLTQLATAFKNSNLPYTIDIVDLEDMDKISKHTIQSQYGPLSTIELQRATYINPQKVRLGECTTLTKGLSYKGEFLNGVGPDLIGLGQFMPGGGMKMKGRRTYSGDHRPKDIVRPGDLLIAMTDLTQQGKVLGSPLIVPDSVGEFCLFTLDAGKLEPTNRITPYFLYYILKNRDFGAFAAAHATGTTVRRVSPADVLAYEFLLPPLVEQRAIARVLGALDDKIELNRRMSETLEEMARALFKSWFVDFDPVRAKLEGRWQPGESLPGLPAHLYDLFPSRLVPSELGDIPAGWKVSPLGDNFRITMGQSPPSKTYNQDGDGMPFYQGRTDFGFRFPSRRIYCTKPARLAEPGDSLVSVRAPVGTLNMAIDQSCVGRGVAAVRHESSSRSYTYYSMNSLRNVFESFEAEGTVFGSVNKRDFNSIPWISPPDTLVAEFDKHCSILDDHLETNELSTNSLTDLRDTLLPKLISGEVCVPLVSVD